MNSSRAAPGPLQKNCREKRKPWLTTLLLLSNRRLVTAVEGIGRCAPLGATVVAGGVNFSVFSRCASAVELLFFDRADDPRPARVIPIDPCTNRTYHYWHTFVPGAQPGQLYGYRVHGSPTMRPDCASIPAKFSSTRMAAA